MTDHVQAHVQEPSVAKVPPSSEELAARLGSAATPALLMLVAHLTGDPDVLRPEWRPDPQRLPDSGLTPEVDEEIRAFCEGALEPFLASGEPWPTEPPPGILDAIGRWAVGPEVAESAGLLETAFVPDGTDPRRPDWTLDEVGPDRAITAVVIGAGLSGLLAGLRLKQAGVPFTILEKDSDVGGTWWENTYPDCRTDVHSHIYTYSFFGEDWPSYFGRQSVIHGYLRRFAEEHGLMEHIRFGVEVTRSDWDEEAGCWQVATRASNEPDGAVEVVATQVLISAVGQLNRPHIPAIKGLDTFAGPLFHSAAWDHSIDFTGKRVAVIGTGASAMQFGPALARIADRVTIFQRSAPWLMPTPELRRDIGEDERWLLRTLPHYRAYYRLSLFLPRAIGQLDAATVDLDYPPTETAVSAANEQLRVLLTTYLENQVGDDPDLLAKVLPDYPPGAKRIVRDDGTWVATLKRDNVDLVSQGIERIDETGIWTTGGEHIEVDAILFGTGFTASDYLTPMTVTGRDGKDLHEHWGIDACAYMGVTVPGFPNFFLMYGPNTNLVLHGNLVFFLECQAAYITSAVKLLAEGNTALDLKQDVYDDYRDEVTEASARRVWGWSKTHSWYQNAAGRSTIMWPLTAQAYVDGTREARADHYVLT